VCAGWKNSAKKLGARSIIATQTENKKCTKTVEDLTTKLKQFPSPN
jgi:hypothetical protein